MGHAIFNRSTAKIDGGWLRNSVPVHDEQTHIAIASEEPPPVNARWDGATGWRNATQQELAADADAAKDVSSNLDNMDSITAARWKALIVVINKRLPANQKITRAELEAEFKANL